MYQYITVLLIQVRPNLPQVATAIWGFLYVARRKWTARRNSPDGAEKFSGRSGENLRTAQEVGQPDVLSDGINTIAGETVGNYAEAAQQLKLKVGGWVQVSLEFSVNDRKTQDGRDFKAQRVRILNISPLWGHEEPAETEDKAF